MFNPETARLQILDLLNIHGEMKVEDIAERTGYSIRVVCMILVPEELKGNVAYRRDRLDLFYRPAFEPGEMSGIRAAVDIRHYHGGRQV